MSGKTREMNSVMKKSSSLNASVSSDLQDNIFSEYQSPREYLDMDILDALLPSGPGDADDDGTTKSWTGNRGEALLHRDSCVSTKSDGSDGFRVDDKHHDANNSLRGDDASALLTTIANLKVIAILHTHSHSMIFELYPRCIERDYY